MPDKMIIASYEYLKSCIECIPIIIMTTKANVKEMGWVKFILAHFIMATLVVVPLLISVSVYFGRAIEKMDRTITVVQEIEEQVSKNSENIKDIANRMENHLDFDSHGGD